MRRVKTKNRLTSIWIIGMLVTAGFLGVITTEPEIVGGAGVLYVGGSLPGNFSSIQEAIDAANPGDTVFVYSKTYYEWIVINKRIDLIGENIPGSRPVIDGLMNPYVVHVDNVNYFNMSGFEVRNSSWGWLYSGIFINSSTNISINNNIIHDNHDGIVLFSSSFVNIDNNIIHDNEDGIMLLLSSFINVQDNEIYNNTNIGIRSQHSSDNNVINNTIHNNLDHGFFSTGIPYYNNKIIGNVVYNNGGDGIHLEAESARPIQFWNNSIINNTVCNHTNDGIFIDGGANNFVIDNIVYNHGWGSINPHGGITLHSSINNLIKGNTVHDNEHGIIADLNWANHPPENNTFAKNTVYNNDYGIRLDEAVYNTFIENSIFDNIINVYIEQQASNNCFFNCMLSNATINVYIKEQSTGTIFINCTLTNPSNDDFNLTEDSHAFLLNTTFDKTRTYYGDTLSTLIVQWFMHVKVIYDNGGPAPNAHIWVNNTFGTNKYDLQVDSEGWERWLIVTEYIEQDLNGDTRGERDYFTPHHDTATDGEHWGYADPFMDFSKVVIISLGSPPPLLPPTNLTTRVVNYDNDVELEWNPVTSLALDHYLIYRAESATSFDFTIPYNCSVRWVDPKAFIWVDPDPTVTSVNDDFYYIVRAANFDESIVSLTSNTAGVWTRTFQDGISTFSLPLEPFVNKDTEFYCQDMNASYIKWMNQTTHTWMRHDKGSSENNTLVEVGEGYEIGFLGKSTQTRFTFTGLPGAMILYDNISFGFDATPLMGDADSLTAKVDSKGNVTLNWTQPTNIGSGDQYHILRSTSRDGFWGTLGVNYTQLVALPFDVLSYQDIGNATAGTEYYYMIVPVNLSTSERGVSSYSIGVWTAGYLAQYDTIGIPLKLSADHTADWYCDNIPETVGINYYIYSEQRWGWHSTRMPAGAYDPLLVMAEGYQISTSSVTKFIFIGG